MKLFFILGNQLFPIKYLDRFKKDHLFFMAEDKGLCTYEKHHKQKILLFLSSMRSYCLLYTSPSPRDTRRSRMPASA